MPKFFLFFLLSVISVPVIAQSNINYESKGDSLTDAHSYSSAIESYSKAISEDTTNKDKLSVLYSKKSRVESVLYQYQKAIDDCSLAIDANPKNGDAYWTRGEAFSALKLYAKAIDDYEKAIDLIKDNNNIKSILYARLAHCEYALKHYQTAIDYSDLAIKTDSTSGDVYEERGLEYYDLGNFQLSAESFSRAISLYKNAPTLLSILYEMRAASKLKLMQYQDAISDCNMSLSINRNKIDALITRGMIYISTGEFQLAENDYEECVSKLNGKPDRFYTIQIYDGKASSDFFLGHYRDAIEDCKKVLHEDSNRYSRYFIIGKSQLKLHLADSATNSFKKVIQLDKSKRSSDYIFSLFYTGNLQSAVEILSDRIKTPKNNYDLTVNYYNMACLQALSNNRTEAISYLKKALDLGHSSKYALFDDDLDSIKNTPEFREITDTKSQ